MDRVTRVTYPDTTLLLVNLTHVFTPDMGNWSESRLHLYYENIDGGHSAAANQLERARRTALEFTYLRRKLFPRE